MYFAATVLFIVGAMNVIYGLVLLFNDEYAVLTRAGLLIFDFTTWGWILLTLGALQVGTGAGALAGQTWARAVGIVCCSQCLVDHAPRRCLPGMGCLMVLATDIIIIYALAAKGGER